MLALLLLPGCHEAKRTSQSSAPDPNDDVFATPGVHELAIELAPHRLKALKQNEESYDYVVCTVRSGQHSWSDVGLRCRGTPAKEFATGKPDLIVTFDKFVSQQMFHGHKRLILQATRDDPSYLAAPIALEMFQQAGVPAPRTTFARVQLNGTALGLYVVLEGVEREFLERHFGQTSGNLYDEGHPPDVTGKLQKARGRDRNDQSDADALAAAALESDPSARWRQLQQRLDMERFLNFMALEVMLWQDDCYSLEARKFRLYHDPTSDLMVFFPKAVERILEKTDGPIMPECKGVVARAVLSTPEGQQRYRVTVAKLLNSVFDPDRVRARAQALALIIRPVAAGSDAASASAFDAAVVKFCDTAAQRAGFISDQIKSSLSQ
jgi:spore coat protein H